MNRMAVGDDGLVDEHGEKLKPKEIDKFIRELTADELGQVEIKSEKPALE